ncbi:BREX system P-loop protein BrxC [Segatella bryantii]|uniref:BREX system P-loop protein BrxC n=1 Tax=Segatella bryantii TaxID=77095 RepID=UPI001EDB4045|nr:BREX system P-loop protein BrxC [Segatella bryantii]UKK73422.1 BREX system P-loop protein BrxC [Segatella bryantii]
MYKIQDLFDPSKKLNRTIESVVTFGANTESDLSTEISEYVVTDKLHNNYEKVIQDLQTAFDDSSKEVGIWVSGFYGSGKSSFAKYLGLSFDKSIMIDGVSFGEKLMSRIQDTAITAMHKTIISRHNPQVVMLDLSTQSVAGKIANVSDIVYYETLKLLGITKSTDQKVMCFIDMLHNEGKYDEFCRLVETEKGKTWESVESNDLAANLIAASLAPRVLPAYFPDSASFKEINLTSAQNEKERFTRLYNLVKEKTGKDKIIFVLDEVGQYVASNIDLILNVQGMMQIFKDEFRGKVWVIATAQQTLTEDNQQAQLNSNELFRLNDRFPIKVDIEANDIKEIITKRLLGKSKEGQSHLKRLFSNNESVLKNAIHLSLQEHSIYNQVLTDESFANLYPFLPVHIDILLSLLQKLASRTGGVGLRSVIRLIRDILVDNHLAEATIGQMAGPEHFYDVLRSDMEKNSSKEIVIAADKAILMFNGNDLAVRICKTIAVMQLLDDFNLSFDNLCALLYNTVGSTLDKSKIRQVIDEIRQATGVTLEEIDGKFQFMTNAILGIREERDKIIPRDSEKAEVLQKQLQDMFSPAPSVNVYSTKTITAGVELNERNRSYVIHTATSLKINIRFVDGASYNDTHQSLLIDSTRQENARTLYWLCTLNKDKEFILQDIVRSQNIKNRHQNETNKEIQAYLRAQSENAEEKMRQLAQILREAMGNSEIIFRGNPQQVDETTYKTVALKSIAEKVFEKYPLASANMKSNCVSQLASYQDVCTIPASLNPLGIINTTDGSIDATNKAIAEVKEFIAFRNEATGQEVITHFEKDPYGWSKDTIRYVVALMLKANVIQIRVSGKDITVFGDTAVSAMDTTNSFNKISISLNSDGALTPQELLKAAQCLSSLFNSSRIAPVKDAIAKEALGKMKYYLPRINSLLDPFEKLHLAGSMTLRAATNYAQRIIDTEGGEAAYLLGKDNDCQKAFRYAMDVMKCNQQASLLDHLKHINYLTKEVKNLPVLPQLDGFLKQISDVSQLYDDYIQNQDLHAIVSDITDLRNKLDSYLTQACVNFQTEGNSQLNLSRDEIMATSEYTELKDSQKAQIDNMLGNLAIDYRSNTLEGLREMINNFVTISMTSVNNIKSQVHAFSIQNTPPVVVTPPVNPQPQPDTTGEGGGVTTTNTVQDSISSPNRLRVKKRITTKAELQSIINELTKLLDSVDENSPVEFNIND